MQNGATGFGTGFDHCSQTDPFTAALALHEKTVLLSLPQFIA